MVPPSARALAGAAIVVLAAAAAVLVAVRHGAPPRPPVQVAVQVAVSGVGPAAAPQQPGIAYGGAGHMVPPTRRPSTASPSDAALVLSTPAGRTRRGDLALPWQQTITVPPGRQVSVSVRSATATSLVCTIAVDGHQVAMQQSGATGSVTCRARS